MVSLKLLQKNFQQYIYDENQDILAHIRKSTVTSEEKLQIYRNNIFETLRIALKNTFPGIWQLLGEECANGVAYNFIKNSSNAPVNGNLENWGDGLPKFLAGFHATKHLIYLQDYAQLEWVRHLSYCASNVMPINAQKLNSIIPDKIKTAKIYFQPSMFLMESIYPLELIEDLLKNPKAKEFTLGNKKIYPLIYRKNYTVITHWCDQTLWQFLSSLKNGYSLWHAYEELPGLDLGKTLSFMLEKHLIYEII